MQGNYVITIEAWPHSTGQGQTKDQEAAGERSQTFTVDADGFDGAYRQAKLLQTGIETNPMVWRAPIVSIQHKDKQS